MATPAQNPYVSPELTGDAPSSAAIGPPTQTRWGVLVFVVTMAVLLYLDRFAFSIAQTSIVEELQVSKEQMGFAVSIFFFSYALAQVPAGWFADRLGGRVALPIFVAAWSVTIAAMGFAWSLPAFVVLRAVLGISQAGAYPTAAGVLKRWMPLRHRGFGNGAVTLGGRSGGLLTNLLTPWLMSLVATWAGIATGSWRAVFCIYGLLGIVWAALFFKWFRDTPAEHPGCNGPELAIIEADRPPVPAIASPKEPFPWLEILSNRNVWLLSVENFMVNVGWIFLAAWLPTYLKEEKGYSLQTAGAFTAATALAGMCGCLSGGVLTDLFMRSFGIVWGRRLPGMLGCGGAALAYVVCLRLENALLVVGVLAGIYFLSDLVLGTTWATYQDIGGAHVGTILGFANMCGNLGAAGCAYAIGYFADRHDWTSVFWISSGSFAIGLLCWVFVDPRITILKEAPAQPV